MASESKRTVYFAMGANVAIAAAKATAGIFTGSTAMLAEAAHSVADITNQVFMLVSLSLGRREPDEEHPFGYGKERFFWAFLAAVFIFVSGAAFSIIKGVQALLSEGPEELASDAFFIASYVVLLVAFLSEGTSWLRAFRQMRGEAKQAQLPFMQYLREGKDPTVKVVLLEDSAALLGTLFAATGIGLFHYTGDATYDAIASIAIGLLLAADAVILGGDAKGLLLGEAALPGDRERIREIIESHEGVERTIQVLTMAVGPKALLVTARIHVAADLRGRDIERIAHSIDQELRAEVPCVREVFLDPTSRGEPPTPPSKAEQEEAAADGPSAEE